MLIAQPNTRKLELVFVDVLEFGIVTNAMDSSSEKPVSPPPPSPSPPASSFGSYFNPVSPFFNAYDRFAAWRRDLGLPHPGSVENLGKEVKGMSRMSLYSRSGIELGNSHASLKLHLRWRESRHDQDVLHEPAVPSDALIRLGLAVGATFV